MDAPTLVTLEFVPGRYAVCRLPDGVALPKPPPSPVLFALTVTPDERSLVCSEELAPDSARVEPGWACLRVRGPLDFSLTGILASLTGPLAGKELPVFALSTFDTDYLLVRAEHLEEAVTALRVAGHAVI